MHEPRRVSQGRPYIVEAAGGDSEDSYILKLGEPGQAASHLEVFKDAQVQTPSTLPACTVTAALRRRCTREHRM